MMEDDDSNSIATTMGVKDDFYTLANRQPRDLESIAGSVTGNSLALPKALGQKRAEMMEDDDVSTLTEYSMEEEDDNISQTTQNTAWTVITTGTDSTTVPTRNFPFARDTRQQREGRKRQMIKENVLLSNSQFKRRRMS
jgi:hypothetical protein